VSPTVRVVGLGPGDLDLVTQRTMRLLRDAPAVRLRTRVHPAADQFGDVASYDEWYERASSFDELYQSIVDDLVDVAKGEPDGEVVYAVPGSPIVAERTVELLRERGDVTVICEPAVSVVDVACVAMGVDPMTSGLRIVDALASSAPLRGPGPLLILQTYSPEVMVSVADRLEPDVAVTVVYHAGLADQALVELRARDLVSFERADHLTSLWVAELRTAGVATDDLVDFMRRLRRDCLWDQEQTHASLTRHLLEESYEVLDALETFVRLDEAGEALDDATAHLREELGDLLFQIVFHAELGDEEGRFDFASIADAVRVKLTGRHPHVFGDVQVSDANEVATRWEVIKRDEKRRESVVDGVVWQQPALSLYAKVLSKAAQVDGARSSTVARRRLDDAIVALEGRDDVTTSTPDDANGPWGDAVVALAELAATSGVDLEGVLRERARRLADHVRSLEPRPKE
jgi:tetrapyrrole methylase family protein/MazG family protein